MAKIIERASITFEASLLLTEREVRALAKVLEWGAEHCVDAILKGTATSETRDYRATLVDLFSTIRADLPTVVRKGDDARKVFEGRAVATAPKPSEGQG